MSFKRFFLDYAVPIGLSFIPGVGPYAAAAYSGIKTGIQTGSPLAGLGAAAVSFGTSSALKGIKADLAGPTSSVANPAATFGESAYVTEGGKLISRPLASSANVGIGSTPFASNVPSFMQGSGIQGPTLGGDTLQKVTSRTIQGAPGFTAVTPSVPPVEKSFLDVASANVFDKGIGEINPELDILPEFITNRSPATIAGIGLATQAAATPPPEPAPFTIPQRKKTDLSKYAYKGPLDRGEYTYADPEDIAYGRTTNYGYLGAKEGGVIKAQGGGVMMQSGPFNVEVEKTKGTFRPTGSMVAPTAGPSISRIAQTQPMMSISPQKIRGLAQPVAPMVPTNMPISQPTPPPMPTLPIPEQSNVNNLIKELPKKDLNVNVDQLRGILGLAEGGEVPTPNIEEIRIGIYKGLNDYEPKNMAEGGEVESNETLQENAFVIPADVVSNIGDGSSEAGARRLRQYFGMNPQQYQAGGIMAGELEGPGGGMDDLIQTTIEGKRAAAVSPQEFVVPRDVVFEIGDGSYDKGANKLYALMRNVRKEKTGTTKQPAELTKGLGQLMRTAVA